MSGTHGVFQHRSGYFYTILEEDFCEVFKAPGVNEVCRAYITSILEHLTNKQYEATGSEKDLWVFMSLPEMARRMRHACSERTIHKELQGMVKDGFIEKRRAVGKATMEYKLNLKRIRKALEALPDGQSCKSATYDLANLQEPSSNFARSTLQNYKNDLANLQARIPIDIPIEETKNNNGGMSSPNVDDAPASENVTDYTVWKVRKTDPHMPALNLKGQSDNGTTHRSTGDSGVPGGLREDLPRSRRGDTPLVEQKPGASPLPSAVSRAGDGGHGDASAQASSQQTLPTQGLPAPAATALTSSPRSSVQQGAGTKRPRTKKPVILELTLQGLQVKSWYEEVRGTKLRMTEKNVAACNVLGDDEDVTFDSLKATIEHLDALKWVIEHDYAIDIQVLASDKSQLNFEKNWPLVKRKLAKSTRQRKPTTRPTLDEVECVDPTWCVYQRPGDDQEWILWQGELCTPEEADERGYAGGGGLYIQTQYA